MITSETPYKLADIIRDTWPQLYRPPLNKRSNDENEQKFVNQTNLCYNKFNFFK